MTRLENNDITILYLFILLLLDLLLGRCSSSSDDHFRSETTITETITEPKSLNLWFLSQGYLEKIYYKITFVLFLLFPPPPIRWLRCLTLLLGHLLKCFKAQKIWIWASSWNLFAKKIYMRVFLKPICIKKYGYGRLLETFLHSCRGTFRHFSRGTERHFSSVTVLHCSFGSFLQT